MFDADRRKDGVHDKGTGGLPVADEAAQDVPVRFARFEDPGNRLRKPCGHCGAGLGKGKRTLEHLGVGGDPEKSPKRQPSEPDEFRSGERRFEPRSGPVMLLGSRMISIEQEVRVNENRR